ncbi:MAG: PKD domain-containing protein [Actinobacteria bacterium]|nr:PKD domain-containing protein [Actinomycetota bacterium]
MSIFSGKKIFLLGFIVVLLIAIPLTVYLARQQQETRSGAAPSTTLSLTPTAQTTTVDQTVSFDIMVNPGSNQVSLVKFTLTFDGTKITPIDSGFVANTQALPNVSSGPTYGTNSVAVTLRVDNPQQSLTLPTKIATITFRAVAPTEGVPTRITFTDTSVMSSGGESSFNENVFLSSSPATVTIDAGQITPTVTPAATVTPAPTVTSAPTQANVVPTCSSLTSDVSSGSASLTVNFTGVGSDSDGTISKATFNFGDGTVEDSTDGQGVNTNSATITKSHIFNSAGAFTTNVVFTDNGGGVSTPSSCTQVINVAAGTITPTTIISTAAPTAVPTALPPTGPESQLLAIGAFGAIISVIGVILLFAL